MWPFRKEDGKRIERRFAVIKCWNWIKIILSILYIFYYLNFIYAALLKSTYSKNASNPEVSSFFIYDFSDNPFVSFIDNKYSQSKFVIIKLGSKKLRDVIGICEGKLI